MIPMAPFSKGIMKEARYWKTQGRTDYVKGILIGLSMALRLGKTLHRAHVQLECDREIKTTINCPVARGLYRALFVIDQALTHGSRRRAHQKLAQFIARYRFSAG